MSSWVGKQEQCEGVVTACGLGALFDYPPPPLQPGDPVPPLSHWVFLRSPEWESRQKSASHTRRHEFLPNWASWILRKGRTMPKLSRHAGRGGFLSKMWAGGRLQFHKPLRVGERVVRLSTVQRVIPQENQEGLRTLVTVRYEILADGKLAISEEHDFVYRTAPSHSETLPLLVPPAEAVWRGQILPDSILLRLYSQLVFYNYASHDEDQYVDNATAVFGDYGSNLILVREPLLATLLVNLLRRAQPEAWLTAFEFRTARPLLFDYGNCRPFQVAGAPGADGRSVHLWAEDADGWLTMEAWATLR